MLASPRRASAARAPLVEVIARGIAISAITAINSFINSNFELLLLLLKLLLLLFSGMGWGVGCNSSNSGDCNSPSYYFD